MPFGCIGPLKTCLLARCQILTLGNALQPEIWPFVTSIFSPMSPIKFFSYRVSGPRSPGLVLVLYYCHVGEKSDLGFTTYGGGIFGKTQFYLYISNVPVQSGPARRPTWQQHITITASIVPRIRDLFFIPTGWPRSDSLWPIPLVPLLTLTGVAGSILNNFL